MDYPTKYARYQLRDYNDAELHDAGQFVYDYDTTHDETAHDGAGMIHDVIRNSDLLEYLSHMLCEHIDNIQTDERTIYIHDDATGFNAYDTTPQFCIHDTGAESLAALKPFLVLRITEITEDKTT